MAKFKTDYEAGRGKISASDLNARGRALGALSGNLPRGAFIGPDGEIYVRPQGVEVYRPILAKVTGVGATAGYYKLSEVIADRSDKTGARAWNGASGNLPEAFDAGCGQWGLPVGTIVRVERGVDSAGDPLWWFDGLSIGEVFPVKLTQTGGSAGSESTACSFTYTVNDVNSNQLGTAVDPDTSPSTFKRPSLGKMVAATGGLACWIEDSGATLSLRWINEVFDVEECA